MKRANGEGSIFPHRSGYGAYKWVTGSDGTRVRKYVYGKDHAEVHARWVEMDTDPYPEHAKMYPHSQFDIIHQFFEYLTIEGITNLTFEEVYELILLWRGVDVTDYLAEGLVLRRKYPQLWKTIVPDAEYEPPKLRVTRKPVTEVDLTSPATSDGVDFLLSKIRGGDI